MAILFLSTADLDLVLLAILAHLQARTTSNNVSQNHDQLRLYPYYKLIRTMLWVHVYCKSNLLQFALDYRALE